MAAYFVFCLVALAFASPVLTSSAPNISTSFHSNPTPSKSHAATSHSALPVTHHITVSTSKSSTLPPTPTHAHNGSSVFPVTSHAPTPPPTEPPTKKPVLKCPSVSYSVMNGSKTCIKINGTIEFSAKYLAGNKTHNRTVKAQPFCLEAHGNVNGHCYSSKSNESEITVRWGKYNLTFKFYVNTKIWYTSEMLLVVDTHNNTNFPDALEDNIQASNEPNQNEKLYRGDKGRSYFCKDDNTVKLNGNNGDEVTIDFQEIQMQPYPLTNDTFAKPSKCKTKTHTPGKSKNNRIVPIAVGCALAGLIIIVLIAYLIGRRKSHRGYQQV